MKYVEKEERGQITLLPDSIEEYVSEDNPVRVIDANTDPEAHRMHTKDGFNCCYNVQTAVDVGSQLIAEYEVTGNNTDQGLLSGVCE